MRKTTDSRADKDHGGSSRSGQSSARQLSRPSSPLSSSRLEASPLCSAGPESQLGEPAPDSGDQPSSHEGQASSMDVPVSCPDTKATSSISQTQSFDTGSPSSLAKSSYTEGRSSWWEHMLYKFRHLLSRLLGMEFIRFAIVGVIATAIHYGIYLLLKLLITVNLAYTAGYLISLACNFFLTAKVTFRTGVSPLRGAGFAASHAVNYLLHMVLLNLFIRLGVPSSLAPVPVYCIAIPVNFILVRTVFRRLH